jgi:hypothetical protein
VVTVFSLPALGHTFQVKIEGDTWVGIKTRHQRLPLKPVGLYTPPGIDLMHDKMGHLMGYGIT